jgi:ribonucleoside-triphosphate reductase
MDVTQFVEEYLSKKGEVVRDNANMTYSLQGLNFHVSSRVMSQFWLKRIYPERIAKAHLNGDFHIHNLPILGPYCVGWDLFDLLVKGFRGCKGKTESKPAKHFRVALGQITNFIFTLQGEAAGAQAFSDFDIYLAPFVRYDNLDYREVKQALQEFIFNMNVPTRVGFQAPFSNLTLSLKVPSYLKDQQVVIGGEFKSETYSDFEEEIKLINLAFAEVMLEGDAKGRPFTFPIPTYNVTPDWDWNSKVITRIIEMAAKYGTPYFANFVNSDMKPEDVRSMCCRLRLDLRKLEKRGGGLFGANPLTGSIGVVTINMPRIGYLAKNEDEFFEILEEKMNLAKESLEIKRKVVEKYTEEGLYPYSRFYLQDVKERLGAYWKQHFSTIGLIGMNEACLNLFGIGIWDESAKKFAEKVLDFMREKLKEFQEETGNLYNLEATPAEGTCFRLAKIDKERFPDIIVANEDEVKKGFAPFYTNSSWLPVDFTNDIWFLLEHQDSLQTRYTGGTVVHVWLGEQPEVDALKAFIRKVFSNFRLPYISITPTYSICPIHGRIAGKHEICPFEHDAKQIEKLKFQGYRIENGKVSCEVFSRVVGYLRPVDQWNDAKQREFARRKMFDEGMKKN